MNCICQQIWQPFATRSLVPCRFQLTHKCAPMGEVWSTKRGSGPLNWTKLVSHSRTTVYFKYFKIKHRVKRPCDGQLNQVKRTSNTLNSEILSCQARIVFSQKMVPCHLQIIHTYMCIYTYTYVYKYVYIYIYRMYIFYIIIISYTVIFFQLMIVRFLSRDVRNQRALYTAVLGMSHPSSWRAALACRYQNLQPPTRKGCQPNQAALDA